MSQDNSLQDLHNTFNTPEDTLFSLVKNNTNLNPISSNKIVKGYENEVYEITIDYENIILRIKRSGETSMAQEAWAIHQCENAGVPVPDIYKVGTFKLENINSEYMIQNKVIGDAVGDIKEHLTKEQLKKIYVLAGKTLRLIHSVKVEGFYKRHEDGKWDFKDWFKYRDSNVIDRSKESHFIQKSGFTKQDFDKMITYLEKYRDEFSCETPVLCHGDYLQEHIFIDSNFNVTGVIDFGMYRGDSLVHDFARLYMDSRFKYMEDLKSGYGDHELFHDRFQERVLLEALGSQMGHLAFYSQKEMKPEVVHTATRLKETCEKLKEIYE